MTNDTDSDSLQELYKKCFLYITRGSNTELTNRKHKSDFIGVKRFGFFHQTKFFFEIQICSNLDVKRFTYPNRGALIVPQKNTWNQHFLFSTGLYELRNLTRFFFHVKVVQLVPFSLCRLVVSCLNMVSMAVGRLSSTASVRACKNINCIMFLKT